MARYWSINTAATAVPLSAHPSPLAITTKLVADIFGGPLLGRGVLPAQYYPCGYDDHSISDVMKLIKIRIRPVRITTSKSVRNANSISCCISESCAVPNIQLQSVQKKRDQNVFCNIFYKTRANLAKFGTPFPE